VNLSAPVKTLATLLVVAFLLPMAPMLHAQTRLPPDGHLRLIVHNGTGDGDSYYVGQTVPVGAQTPSGFEFVKWFKTEGDGSLSAPLQADGNFIMGRDNSEIAATFAKLESWFPPGPEGNTKGLLLPKPQSGQARRLEQRLRITLNRGSSARPPYSEVLGALRVKMKWKEATNVRFFTTETGGQEITNEDVLPKDSFKPKAENVYEASIWYEGNLTQEQISQISQSGNTPKVTIQMNFVVEGNDKPISWTGALMPVDIRVYRPQEVQEAVTWNLTRKQKTIPDSEIEQKKVGIRVNKDGTDGGNENDLIEVEFASTILDGFNLVIKRTSPKLRVFASRDGTNVVLDQSEVVVPDAMKPPTSYWVECTDDMPSGDVEFYIRPKSGGQDTKLKALPFRSFSFVVCALSGEVWGNPASASSQGLYKICENLYLDGYNIHYFPESSEARALAEIRDERNNCGIQKIGVCGYSHGGGSTYRLAVAIGQINFSGYIDAIANSYTLDTLSEDRYPIGSAYHFNYYQRNWSLALPLRGDKTKPPGANIEKDFTSTTDHMSIDDNATVANDLKAALKAQITP